ncbi:DUF805 domain-containing protein [uncultured Streptococcus sp.]|uniref:DUF805 domain-containing protein n=1 Tax=uncultured Streptococcus sp. TaxID=83427 RepID=UPI0028DB1910|nr:DUF805 domain-containing protein [uncultured Streptococcus sp.]
MIEAYKKFWKGYVDFKGRSTPSDLWSAYLAHVLIVFAGYWLDAVFESMVAEISSDLFTISVILYLILFIFCIAAVLPCIAVAVRRLRDAGYHWAYIFIPLIPFVGIFILVFLLCQPTEVEVPVKNVDNPRQ